MLFSSIIVASACENDIKSRQPEKTQEILEKQEKLTKSEELDKPLAMPTGIDPMAAGMSPRIYQLFLAVMAIPANAQHIPALKISLARLTEIYIDAAKKYANKAARDAAIRAVLPEPITNSIMASRMSSLMQIDKPLPEAFDFLTLRTWTERALAWREFSTKNGEFDISEKIELGELNHAIRDFGREASSLLNRHGPWLNNKLPASAFFSDENFDPDTTFYAQRIVVPADAKIVIMGDFHGSLHSLLRNLWRLKVAKILSDDFKLIDNKAYLIFTGDFVDRGRFSAETLYTLLRLKLANFDRVHLIRGNHEATEVSYQYGLFKELTTKYQDVEGRWLFKEITGLFRLFPVAIFATIGNGPGKDVLHFSHGGFGFNVESKKFIASPREFINAPAEIVYWNIEKAYHWGYAWTDFSQSENARPNRRGLEVEDGAHIAGIATLNQYLLENNIKAVFRGHQDQEFGVKMLFKDPNDPNIAAAQRNTRYYKNGPFHWRDVVRDRMALKDASSVGISLNAFAPVITFTSASEGQELPFDAYGILKCRGNFENSRLEIHEIPLVARPQKSYLSIENALLGDDGIHPVWQQAGPGRCMLR